MVGNVNFTCQSNPAIKCSAQQVCIGGGLIASAGVGFNFSGAVYGAPNSQDLAGWSGAQGVTALGPIAFQYPWTSPGGSFTAGPSLGAGVAIYVRCKISRLKCSGCTSCAR